MIRLDIRIYVWPAEVYQLKMAMRLVLNFTKYEIRATYAQANGRKFRTTCKQMKADWVNKIDLSRKISFSFFDKQRIQVAFS